MKAWSSDRWISLVAIIASLGTLFTIVYQTELIRKQQYASVLPYLEIWNSWDGDSYRLVLANNGVGPAFVEQVSIIYADSTYFVDPANFLPLVAEKDTIKYSYSNLYIGRLIPAGSSINLIQGADSLSSMKLWSWLANSDASRQEHPNLVVAYRSIYEERWKVEQNGANQPIKLN